MHKRMAGIGAMIVLVLFSSFYGKRVEAKEITGCAVAEGKVYYDDGSVGNEKVFLNAKGECTVDSTKPTTTSIPEASPYAAPKAGLAVVVEAPGVTPEASPTVAVGFSGVKINAGGPVVGDWKGDGSFTGGQIYKSDATVAGLPTEVGQTERYGSKMNFDYRVPDGTYKVTLSFAENYFSEPYRKFKISTTGPKVLEESLDVFKEAGGKNKLLQKSYELQASNGMIHLEFEGLVNNALVNGIEIVSSDGKTPIVVASAKPYARLPGGLEEKPAPKPSDEPAMAPKPIATPTPVATGGQDAAWKAGIVELVSAIRWQFGGRNGQSQGGLDIGLPCVPLNYDWATGGPNGQGQTSPQAGTQGRGQQLAGAAYNQIYNVCPRKTAPNARIKYSQMAVLQFRDGNWSEIAKGSHGGAAFAEDFVNNQATGADIQDEGGGYKSVRSGIGSAGGEAGSSTGRSMNNGRDQVGFNFHGFLDRFNIDWSKAQAVLVVQKMQCVGADCALNSYEANVGLDSWASTGSNFDGFKTHGGVSGGRFIPITTTPQWVTNYVGPLNLLDTNPPPVPNL
jgi:Malectin domain